MDASHLPIPKRENSAAHDDNAVYIGLADSGFLLLALWLSFASLTVVQHSQQSGPEQKSITIKSDKEQPNGMHPKGSGVEFHPVTHVLEGKLLASAERVSDGVMVVEVPSAVFLTLQQASSVKIVTHKQ